MSPAIIFNTHLVLGYVCWLLCWPAIWSRLRVMERTDALRLIAMVHSFRFFGLVFILPGVVGADLPAGFAPFAAYGDFATGLLAMLALLTVGVRPLFWLFAVAFNMVGAVDIIVDYYHGVRLDLPSAAGQLGAAYAIVVLYVPILMITHAASFYMLLRSGSATVRGEQAASGA